MQESVTETSKPQLGAISGAVPTWKGSHGAISRVARQHPPL